jgi:adenylyltransferase/sulfurtransferase
MGDGGLTREQLERYDRNVRLAGVGEEGQRRLLASSALVVGAGGLGSAAILYLAAAGVGRLAVADAGRLERSNLNRQVLHRTGDLGRAKIDSARGAVQALNPDCRVETRGDRLTAANARRAVRGFDVALDCSDNFPTRLALADACWIERVPLVSGAVVRMEGLLLTVLPAPGNPCYRCLVPAEPPAGEVPTAAESGILGAVAGMMGALEAVEALKLLLGLGRPLVDRLLVYDGAAATFRETRRVRDPGCPLCGDQPTITDASMPNDA